MLRFLREVAMGLGVDGPVLERAVSPAGADLYGIRCPDAARRDALWQRLRQLHRATGFWPFLSHESPAGWEWEDREPSGPGTAGTGVLAELVDAAGAGTDARHVDSATGALAPYARGELLARHFAREPEWICLVEADLPSTLTRLLHAPCTPNQSADGPAPPLGYDRHQAVLREWELRYGAALHYLGSGALVLEVARPPADRAEIARVAVEQYAYCPDLDQVIGARTTVAERQVPSPHWFFWWD